MLANMMVLVLPMKESLSTMVSLLDRNLMRSLFESRSLIPSQIKPTFLESKQRLVDSSSIAHGLLVRGIGISSSLVTGKIDKAHFATRFASLDLPEDDLEDRMTS